MLGTFLQFVSNIRQIIADDETPFYRMELTEDDLVIFRPRKQKTTLAPNITLPEWAEEKSREIARAKGWDYYALRSKWMDFAAEKSAAGDPPKNAGAAFVKYCEKQDNLRG